MRAAATIEEKNIHRQPTNTALKRMSTLPPHTRIPRSRDTERPNRQFGRIFSKADYGFV
jgi:hypothetical protein